MQLMKNSHHRTPIDALIVKAEQLSAGRSDEVSERSPAPGSGSRWKAKSLPHEGVFGGKNPPKNKPRGVRFIFLH
jgi:hypothetical protein